jgi:hypothetical protein
LCRFVQFSGVYDYRRQKVVGVFVRFSCAASVGVSKKLTQWRTLCCGRQNHNETINTTRSCCWRPHRRTQAAFSSIFGGNGKNGHRWTNGAGALKEFLTMIIKGVRRTMTEDQLSEFKVAAHDWQGTFFYWHVLVFCFESTVVGGVTTISKVLI